MWHELRTSAKWAAILFVPTLFAAKPFAPDRVGLWVLPDPTGDLSLSLGRHGTGAAGHDVLGWWIIPIGLAVGVACAVLTYRVDLRFIRQLARPQSTATSPSI